MNIAGVCADRDPHRFVANEGLFELAENGPEKILNTIPSVCKILKSMAQMKNAEISYQAPNPSILWFLYETMGLES